MGFDLEEFAFTFLPDPHIEYDRFNNDLSIQHYKPSIRPYSGTQRKGICEPFPSVTSYMEHIYEALQAPSPLAEQTSLPIDLVNALNSHRDNSRETIRGFQNSQLKTLRIIAQECGKDTDRWYRLAPTELKNTAGTVQIALLARLTRFTWMKGGEGELAYAVRHRVSRYGETPTGISVPPQRRGGFKYDIA